MDLPIQLRFTDTDEYLSYVKENKDEFYESVIYGIQKAVEEGKDELTIHEVAFMDLRTVYSVYYEEEVYSDVLNSAIKYFSSLENLSQTQSDLLLDAMNLKNRIDKT